MILTPICPRSLSFRSLVLPPSVVIRMKLSEKARGDASVSGDGKSIFNLTPGFMLQVFCSLVLVSTDHHFLRMLADSTISILYTMRSVWKH